MARLNILLDPAFLELRPVLSERLGRIGDRIYPGEFSSLLDPLMREELEHGFREARADEGTVWLLDESRKNLVPGFNSGARAADLVGKFTQPLNAGLICMVFAGEQPSRGSRKPAVGAEFDVIDACFQHRSYARRAGS